MSDVSLSTVIRGLCVSLLLLVLIAGALAAGHWDRPAAADPLDPSITMTTDLSPGDGNPPGDVVHRGLASAHRVTLNTDGPADTDLQLLISGPTSCQPHWTTPLDPSPINIPPLMVSTVNLSNVGAGSTQAEYTVNCNSSGMFEVQIVANVTSESIPSDPNPLNNQAEEHPQVSAQCDADGDTVCTPADNCPNVVNMDQMDTDADLIGDVCDDDDGDGIENSIDVAPLAFSNMFSDQPGGTSSGSIMSRAGLTVQVHEAINPAGMHVTASGAGGPAMVTVCGIETLSLMTGADIVVTCGSATVQVLQGPVNATAGTLKLMLPAGTTSTVQQMGAGYSISNSAGSSGSITVNGGTLAAGATADDQDNDGFLSSVESFVGTSPTLACGGVNAWPVDNNGDNMAGLSDILAYIPVYGYTGPGLPYKARYDLNADNKVGLSDILMFIPFFNLMCTP